MSGFINTALKSDSESSDSESFRFRKIGSKFDAKLMTKLKSGSENDPE